MNTHLMLMLILIGWFVESILYILLGLVGAKREQYYGVGSVLFGIVFLVIALVVWLT